MEINREINMHCAPVWFSKGQGCRARDTRNFPKNTIQERKIVSFNWTRIDSEVNGMFFESVFFGYFSAKTIKFNSPLYSTGNCSIFSCIKIRDFPRWSEKRGINWESWHFYLFIFGGIFVCHHFYGFSIFHTWMIFDRKSRGELIKWLCLF